MYCQTSPVSSSSQAGLPNSASMANQASSHDGMPGFAKNAFMLDPPYHAAVLFPRVSASMMLFASRFAASRPCSPARSDSFLASTKRPDFASLLLTCSQSGFADVVGAGSFLLRYPPYPLLPDDSAGIGCVFAFATERSVSQALVSNKATDAGGDLPSFFIFVQRFWKWMRMASTDSSGE